MIGFCSDSIFSELRNFLRPKNHRGKVSGFFWVRQAGWVTVKIHVVIIIIVILKYVLLK